jgi:RNase P/RNase MRP subunit POP5
MKPLIPSHRERKRYLLLKGKNLKKNVYDSIKEFIGILGLSEVSLKWIKKDVLCINRRSLDKVRASFVVWPEEIKILKVSGSLRGLRSKSR